MELKEEYKPKKEIDSMIYKEVTNLLTLEEWIWALSKTRNDTAPEISNIGYILFKKLPPKVIEKILILVISLSMIHQLDTFELKYNYTKFYILTYN